MDAEADVENGCQIVVHLDRGVVAVRGAVDEAAAAEVEAILRSIVDRRHIQLDLTAVESIDASGLRALAEIRRRARERRAHPEPPGPAGDERPADGQRPAVAREAVVHLDDGGAGVLARVAELAASLIGPCEAASVTVLGPKGPMTAGASSPLAVELDDAQHRAQRGPTLDAVRRRTPVRCADLTLDDRWVAFRRSALDLDIRSVLATPLPGPTGPVGALTVYVREVGPLGDDHLDLATRLAAEAARVVVADAVERRDAGSWLR
jgi:GAF domain-containing protein